MKLGSVNAREVLWGGRAKTNWAGKGSCAQLSCDKAAANPEILDLGNQAKLPGMLRPILRTASVGCGWGGWFFGFVDRVESRLGLAEHLAILAFPET